MSTTAYQILLTWTREQSTAGDRMIGMNTKHILAEWDPIAGSSTSQPWMVLNGTRGTTRCNSNNLTELTVGVTVCHRRRI